MRRHRMLSFNTVYLAALLLVCRNDVFVHPGSTLSYVPQGEQLLRNVMVVQQADGSEKVFVGSSNSLARLSSSLVLENESSLLSLNRMLVEVEISNERRLLTCQMDNCTVFEQLNLGDNSDASFPPGMEDTIIPGTQDVAVQYVEGGSSFFAGRRPTNMPLAMVPSAISKLSLQPDLSINVIGSHEEQNRFRDRQFLHSFSNGQFVYFVFKLPVDTTLDMELRISRICKTDEGDMNGKELTTYTEALLDCDQTVDDYFSATSVNMNDSIYIVSAGFDMAQNTDNLCLFSLAEIDQAMDLKLNNCRVGMGSTQLKRDANNDINDCPSFSDQAQIELIQVCHRPGPIGVPLETEESVTGVSLTTFPSDYKFNSLTVTEVSDTILVFGGGRGNIVQFYLPSTESLEFVRTIPLDEGQDQYVDELHVSGDGEFLYALTQSRVFKLPVDRCDTYESCDACTSSGDPICGWCTVSRSCSRQKFCNTQPTIWVQETSACPVINSVTPSVLYTHLVDSATTVDLNVSNIPDLQYTCVYTFDMKSPLEKVVTASTIATGSLTCRVPFGTEIPPFVSGKETQFVTLALQAGGMDIVTVNGSDGLSFTDCSALTKCTSCLDSDRNCQWCPMELTCISPFQSCPDGVSLDAPTGESCPAITPSGQGSGDYFIHTDISTILSVNARNLDLFDDNDFYCVISNSTTEFYHKPGIWDEVSGTVNCMMSEFNNIYLSVDMPRLDANLEVRWQDTLIVENPQNVRVTFYSCPALGQDCGQCLSIGDVYQCGYCRDNSSCLVRSECSASSLFYNTINDISNCEPPTITSFTPTSGPTQGGTMVSISGKNLGADASHVSMIWIGGVFCQHDNQQYIPGRRVVCTTDVAVRAENEVITITFTFNNVSSLERFSFLNAALNRPVAFPSIGPESGGTVVAVLGENLDIGTNRTVELEGRQCIILEDKVTSDNITCITTRGSADDQGNVGNVRVDIDTQALVRSGFNYVPDPTFGGVSPRFSFSSGGTEFVVTGTNLNSVLYPRLLYYAVSGQTNAARVEEHMVSSEPCVHDTEADEGTSMTCLAPILSPLTSSSEVRIGLEMDGVMELLDLNENLTVYQDPVFNNLSGPVQVDPGSQANISIRGSHFNFLVDQLTVDIGDGTYECIDPVKDGDVYSCTVTVPNVAEPGTHNVVVILGYQTKTVGMLEVPGSPNILYIIIIIFAGLVVLGLAIFIVIIAVMYRKYKLKDEQNDFLLCELGRLEANVAHECKLGFAELQTDLDELTGDLTGTRLPYQEFRVYIMQCLFPGAKDHPVLRDLELPSHRRTQVTRAVRDFHSLIQNKTVLLTLIHALERQKGFSIRDKSNFGSLLMIALHDRLDYATEVLKRLLSDLVRRAVAESYPKLLLRRTESVAEKLLSSWLAFTLHGYVVEHVGQPMYLLFKAVKAQLEKGPIDVITGEARYSLSEQKLIRQQLDVQSLNVTVEADDGIKHPLKLLDCDSISQAKEKMMDVIYRGVPVSQRPSLVSVDVEFWRTPRESYLLRDEDDSNYVENGWKRVNTLSHYSVPDHAVFRLVPRKQQAPPGKTFDYMGVINISHGTRHRTISETDIGTRVWHLSKQVEEDLHASPFINKKMVTEIYLPRMLSTKTILQKFVDDMFSSIFTLTHPPSSPSHLYTPMNSIFPSITASQLSYAPDADSLPVAIKYLFDFLDDEAANCRISDVDVVHMWKNNSIALRFWVNLIKNPEFVFDVSKSATVDACLSVIAQAFIDGCSSSDFRPTINSPTSKLLYNKDVQGYKTSVKAYYEEIHMLERVSDELMMQYLRELSSYQQQLLRKSGGFNISSALYEMLRYVIKYESAILEALRSSGLEAKASLLEAIVASAS